MAGVALAVVGLGVILVALLPYAAPGERGEAVGVPSDGGGELAGEPAPFSLDEECSPVRGVFGGSEELERCRESNERRRVVAGAGLVAVLAGVSIWAIGDAGARTGRPGRPQG